jgi:AbrB family looped-hinge helix DNA binding protein
MSRKRFTAHVGERGRFVVPVEVRRELDLDSGDLVVIDVREDAFVVRKATDVAHGFRGYLRELAPEHDLASELIADRRAEAKRESSEAKATRGSGVSAQR